MCVEYGTYLPSDLILIPLLRTFNLGHIVPQVAGYTGYNMGC